MTKQKLLTLTADLQTMITRIRTKRELPTDTMVFYTAVIEMYNREFKDNNKE